MKKIVVFGYGNTLCSDDGLGVVAAEQLAEQVNPSHVQVIVCQQLSPEHVEHLRLAQLAIFIDANSFGAPGEISCVPIHSNTQLNGGITHQFQPAALLALCQTFFGSAPEAYLYSVGAGSFDLGESLTAPVQAALAELLQRVRGRISVQE